MNEETLKELIDLSKKAMKIVSMAGKNRDLVFDLRDVIRKAESEIKSRDESDRQ